MKILLIDNFDSFTFNLSHYLQIGGADVTVMRINELHKIDSEISHFDGYVLSPGPGRPDDSPELMRFLNHVAGKKPILGVCLGMQAIGLHYGWKLRHAEAPVHGKSSLISHSGTGIFDALPGPLQVGRYHSLIIENTDENTALLQQAACGNEVMSVCTADQLVWGIQFHPESVLTPEGQTIINNWLKLSAGFKAGR